jgi:hypothetical protein
MKISSTTGKLLIRACCAALGAFVVGLCLGFAIKHFDNLYATAIPAVSQQRDCKEERIYIPVVLHFLQHAFLEFWDGCVKLCLV